MFVQVFKTPTVVTALLVTSLVGLACSSLTSPTGSGAVAGGGQTGSTSTSSSGGCGQGCASSVGGSGVPCSGPLLCNPGDTLILLGDTSCEAPNFCYEKALCAQSIVCQTWRTTACSLTSPDAGPLGPQGTSAGGSDAGRTSCCGDGIVDADHGEQCDMGNMNGLVLDANRNPTDAGGCPLCSTDCTIPFCLL